MPLTVLYIQEEDVRYILETVLVRELSEDYLDHFRSKSDISLIVENLM
jgi:hypothetical protein